MKFIGVWGDKFSIDGRNIKIEKKEGKVFWICDQDIKDFLKLQDLFEAKFRIELEVNNFKIEK